MKEIYTYNKYLTLKSDHIKLTLKNILAIYFTYFLDKIINMLKVD